jgi:GT2 family glycosyltransferase|tara:strand:- start:577 stop:1380 length:804 start_codon:yes stop_codon:yes gene_type:complete
MSNIRLSIIIITWNEKIVLDRCLSSFYNNFDFNNDELVIVDNGSEDKTLEVLSSKYPNAKVLALDKNYGVGPARNRGLILSRGKYLMTLDNDTILNQEVDLGHAVDKFLSENSNVGVFGFKLLNSDGTFQQSCRRFPGWLQPLAARLSILQKFPFFKNIQSEHMMEDVDFGSVQYPYEVDYVLGANQIYRRETFAKLNGYDDKIFFGPEDFDFCYRAKNELQLKNYLSDDVEIVHDYTRRTRKFNLITLKHIVSYYYIMFKNRVRRL